MDFNFKKANQSLDKLPFGKRLSAVGSLVKSSLSVIGKDKDITTPWIRMMIYNLLMVFAFFYFLLGFLLPFPYFGLGLPLAFCLFICKPFYNNKQEMRMSWTVFETIIGHDPSYKGATEASKQVKSEIRHIAWLDIGMSTIEKTKWFGGGGIFYFIIRLFISGIEEVWDLANHYMIPSVAIDKLGLKESFTSMKKLKDQVPETLVGVFGIDFIGSVVRRVTWPVYLILGIISIGLSYWLGPKFPSIASSIQVGNDAVTMTWVPIFIAFSIGKVLSVSFERTITALKIVYFTVFYTRITHPERISPAMKEELLAYLKMKDVEEVSDLDQQETEESQPGIQPATA